MKAPASILWFRLDLRLADNPALEAVASRGNPVIPLFIWSPEEEAPWAPGAASRWWLHRSLLSLDRALRDRGLRLVFRRGNVLETLLEVARESGAGAVFWNRRYEPAILARDTAAEKGLIAEGLTVQTFNSSLLNEPGAIVNKSGKPFQVFTAYWKTCLSHTSPAVPLPSPKPLAGPRKWPRSDALEDLRIRPVGQWADGFARFWKPGEQSAVAELERFLNEGILNYDEGRNAPHLPGTSRLSPYLHFGEISPRSVWAGITRFAAARSIPESRWRAWQFVAELGWREFAHHLLFHFPHTAERPLRPEFEKFPWGTRESLLQQWQQGRTGYPLVDAGLRQLWASGWMHNRVRMVVASFLVKNLLVSWQEGARWFWDTLVDADLASNTLGWQWSAGCGADAAPYFRIFNPVTQGEKFDPEGVYVRRWVPELSKVPAKFIHKPWQTPPELLRSAGVELGREYPEPMVSLFASRAAALEAYQRMRTRG